MFRFTLNVIFFVFAISVLVVVVNSAEEHSKPEEEDQIRISVPKCCDFGYVITETGCVEDNTLPFKPALKVYEHNDTHINDDPLDKIQLQPYVQHIECEYGKYPLVPNLDPLLSDGDNFVLFQNGSLVLIDVQVILSQDDFCLETVHIGDVEDGVWITSPFLCVLETDNSESRFGFFVVGCIARAVSAVSLVVVLIAYLYGVNYPTTHDTCIVFYATFVLAKDVLVWIAQFTIVQGNLCSVVAAFYHALLLLALVSLNQIFVETHRLLKKLDGTQHWSERHLEFCGITSLLTASALILIGIIYPTVVPLSFVKLHPEQESCIFMGDKISASYYLVPSFVVIVSNVVTALFPVKEILKYDNTQTANLKWEEMKNMLFATNLLLILWIVIWLKAVFEFLWELENGLTLAVDILESLMGLFTLLLYVVPRRRRVFERFKFVGMNVRQFLSRREEDNSTESRLTEISVCER